MACLIGVKERDVCDGSKEFVVTNKQGELVLKSPSLSLQEVENIYYPQAVKNLATKYGPAQNSVRYGKSEVFYWIDKDWVLRIELLLDDKKFIESTMVKKATAVFVNPKAYAR